MCLQSSAAEDEIKCKTGAGNVMVILSQPLQLSVPLGWIRCLEQTIYTSYMWLFLAGGHIETSHIETY